MGITVFLSDFESAVASVNLDAAEPDDKLSRVIGFKDFSAVVVDISNLCFASGVLELCVFLSSRPKRYTNQLSRRSH